MGRLKCTSPARHVDIEAMVIDMNEAQVRTVEQMRQVLEGMQAIESARPR